VVSRKVNSGKQTWPYPVYFSFSTCFFLNKKKSGWEEKTNGAT
jgi:hypothetical protein